jgi:hypothetical protein
MFNNFKKKKLWAIAAFVVAVAFVPVVIDLFSDPYELGIKAMKAENYSIAKNWMLKVPESHPKYQQAVNLLDEEKGQIGVALVHAGRLEMEKEREADAVADKERKDNKLKESVITAQVSCMSAAVKAAKWDGAESDLMPKSQVTPQSEDTLLVRGQDVKFVNGFGAKRYAEYSGIYNLKNNKCTIIDIAG